MCQDRYIRKSIYLETATSTISQAYACNNIINTNYNFRMYEVNAGGLQLNNSSYYNLECMHGGHSNNVHKAHEYICRLIGWSAEHIWGQRESDLTKQEITTWAISGEELIMKACSTFNLFESNKRYFIWLFDILVAWHLQEVALISEFHKNWLYEAFHLAWKDIESIIYWLD
jgi:hypothetical protein